MASTLLILAVASSALALVWLLLHAGHSEICNGQDWEEKKHDIDVQIFQAILDRDDEHYLRRSLSRSQFESVQRKRIRLALQMLQLAEENAGMLMRLGELARMGTDRALTQKADELIATAIQFRVNLLSARLWLSLKWFFPSWTVSVPPFEVRYRHLEMRSRRLLDSLIGIQ
jgi:hypothetical protein